MSDKPKPFDAQAFLEALAPHLLGELRPPTEMKCFTTNPAIVGAYVETAVRALLRRYVSPLRVSTGAVIDQSNTPRAKDLPQVDTIIWTPLPVPAIFEAGDFGLVPRGSSMGILEIKSSAYDIPALEERLNPEIVATLTADPIAIDDGLEVLPALGVVCVREESQGSKRLTELRDGGRVVVLFEQQGDDFEPQTHDIYTFINFLAWLRLRARNREGLVHINVDVLGKRKPAK